VHSVARQAVEQGTSFCNDATHFHKKQVFWCLSSLAVFLPQSFLRFCLLASVSLALSLSVSALMSQAHCAERSGSDVSVLLALNSRDGA